MLLGYIDLQQMHDAASKAGGDETEGDEHAVIEVPVEVSHRVSMSLRGFFHLVGQIEEISALMKAGGIIFPDEGETDTEDEKR